MQTIKSKAPRTIMARPRHEMFMGDSSSWAFMTVIGFRIVDIAFAKAFDNLFLAARSNEPCG
jgi:hypothetical protein